MRAVSSWIAIFVLVLPVHPVRANDTDVVKPVPPRAPTLEERLRDMPGEAARFLAGSPESERLWLHGVDIPQIAETEDATEAARLRLRIRQLEPGTVITISLRDGERVRGELANADEQGFGLNVPHPTGGKSVKLMRTFRYEEVRSAELPEPRGWSEPEAIREFPLGKRIEVLLLDGSKLRGDLTSITGSGFALDVGRNDIHEYSFDEVSRVRSTGMSANLKIIIGLGVTVGVLVLLGVLIAPYAGY